VEFFQFSDSPGEVLSHSLLLPLDRRPDTGEPLVIDHQRLDLGLGERVVPVENLPI
jgi:hypothetical protein